MLFLALLVSQQYGWPEGEPLPPLKSYSSEAALEPRTETDGVFVATNADGSNVYLGKEDRQVTWSVSCKVDAITDQRRCSITHYPFEAGDPYIVYSSAADREGGICIVEHDFPGRTAMIRIDTNPAITAGTDGCVTLSSLAAALRRGGKWTSRRYTWPNDYAVDHVIDLRGISVALDALKQLRVKRW